MTRRPRTQLPVRLLLIILILVGWAATALAAGPTILHPRGIIEGHYIVVLKTEAGEPAAAAAMLGRVHGFEPGFVYGHALRGFAAELPPAAAAALARHPLVASIEPDRTVEIMAQIIPTGISRIFAPDNDNLGIDGTDDLRVDADVAVLDTGIDAGHPDLNVVASVNCSGGSPFRGSCQPGGSDGNGHGTHVAGTIAAIDNGIGVVGVAPGARLWAVKVLADNGSGYLSWIIAGIDWVTARADQIQVANMSLGFQGSSAALDEAISKSVAAGITYAVSAGNEGRDASGYSPASHEDVITVSALADFDGLPGGLGAFTCLVDVDDTLADFSNFGDAIDLAAPGVCILSTWPGSSYRIISGTSMAAPHVAGAAALLASMGNYDPATISNTLKAAGNYNWNDTSGDGITEVPLLDVGEAVIFAPTMVAGSEPGLPDQVATVTISSPKEGDEYLTDQEILFAATADDGAEGDLSDKLAWSSNLSGPIGSGASLSTNLRAGDHTITAQLSDPAASDSVNIKVYAMPGDAFGVHAINYAAAGGKDKNRHLTVTVLVHNADDQPAAGVAVAVKISNTTTGAVWNGTATTGSNGEAAFAINNHPDGTYKTEVLSLNGEEPGEYNDPGYIK